MMASVAWTTGSLGVLLALFWAGRNDGLSDADEGYLVYGAGLTRGGGVPVRDFRSYEPGRYWLTAALSGRRVTVRRTRLVAMAAHGLALGVLVAALEASGVGWPTLVLVVLVGASWSYLPYRGFDVGTSFATAAVLVMAYGAAPTSGWWFVAGVAVGAAATIGVNLALYAGLSAGLLSLSHAVAAGDDWFAVATDLAGRLVVGFALGVVPLALTSVVARGFAAVLYHRRVRAVVRRGTTNLPVPYPWPWRAPTRGLRPFGRAARAASVVAFVAFVTVAVITVATLVDPLGGNREPAAAMAACAVVGLVTWHHVASRFDLSHWSTSAPIALTAIVVGVLDVWAPSGPWAIAAWGVVAVAVGLGVTAYIMRAGWVIRRRSPHRYRRPEDPRLPATTRHLWFTARDAALLDRLAPLMAESGEAPWVAVPMQVWVLPLVGRRSAIYDNYCVYAAAEGEEGRMIAELTAAPPAVAVIGTVALDGDPARRFMATHPRVYDHIVGSMRRRSDLDADIRGIEIYTARPVST